MIDAYKAVFFDAGGTLFHPYPSVGEIYAEVARPYGCQVDAALVEKTFREIWLRHDGLAALDSSSNEKIEKDWWRKIVREVFSRIGEVPDFENFFEELYEVFGRPSVWRIYPGVLDVLKELKRRGKFLGIVSNWDSRLFQLCDGLGLKDYFDFVLASAVFGAAKPGKRIFLEALRLSGNRPTQEVVHVGDSLEDDVFGARAVGMHAILINRHPERSALHEEALRDVCVIHDLWELIR